MKFSHTGLAKWAAMERVNRWRSLAWFSFVSILIYASIRCYGIDTIVANSEMIRAYALDHRMIISSIIFVWSLILFTTISRPQMFTSGADNQS